MPLQQGCARCGDGGPAETGYEERPDSRCQRCDSAEKVELQVAFDPCCLIYAQLFFLARWFPHQVNVSTLERLQDRHGSLPPDTMYRFFKVSSPDQLAEATGCRRLYANQLAEMREGLKWRNNPTIYLAVLACYHAIDRNIL